MAHELATQQSKRFYGEVCIFSGMPGVDGMHIFSAGKHKLLADFFENIVPGNREHHTGPGGSFDVRADGTERPVAERLWMLRQLSLEEVRPRINKAMRMLALRCEILHIQFPEPEAPIDEKILRNRQSSWLEIALAEKSNGKNGKVSFASRGEAGHGDSGRLVQLGNGVELLFISQHTRIGGVMAGRVGSLYGHYLAPPFQA